MLQLPAFDGTLLTDAAALQDAADDFGHIIKRTPVAVLRPGSVADVQKLIVFARQNGIKVAMRGQAHATYGQAQVEAGVVVDSTALNAIESIQSDRAVVGAGVKWSDLTLASLEHGLTPPVMTDYIDLSIGGTVSGGGIGGATHQHGVQADNVLELDVVTGTGELVTCSKQQNRDLFDAVRAGLGQFGIIVRATVKLIPAETHARVYLLYYDNLETFTEDQVKLMNSKTFDYLEGQVVSAPNGGWRFMLEAAYFYTPQGQLNNSVPPKRPGQANPNKYPNGPSGKKDQPDDDKLLKHMRDNRAEAVIADQSYFDFLNRLASTIAFLKQIGVWTFPHPWIDEFVPGRAVVQHVSEVLADLTLADTGKGPILLYPIKTNQIDLQFFSLPKEPVAFLFSILRTAPPDPAVVQQMIADNRSIYERNRDLGGTRYAIGAVPFTQQDWQHHFGAAWPAMVAAKQRYDPSNVLTPGHGIFP
ncbi:MAG TPA: FAD-binding protein [Roseiflexaceae bacterium]|nr:FAD-binding protein [Roseiflexaceae bacterium]